MILFLLFIFPLIIYLSYKINRKKKFKTELEICKSTYLRPSQEMAEICSKSRVNFFGRQKA
ncbi:MAG: hypothetical protein LBT55_02410 [Clostridiaceae bacterium]|nr:hypothetical protein [Clostridiaceae bacterium]